MTNLFKKNGWLWILFLFLFIIFISLFSTSSPPKEYPAYMTESPSPTGTKAIYTYLKEENITATIEETSPLHLANTDQNQLRILIDPPILTNEDELDGYKEYIQAGNQLVVLKENPDGWMNINASPFQSFEMQAEETYELQGNNEKYEAISYSNIRLEHHETDTILLKDEYGTIGLKRAIGEGSLIVITEPQWSMNQHITKTDHAEILLDTIHFQSAEQVIFDQYKHVQSPLSSVSVYPDWTYVILIEGILLTILWLWFRGKRFGPIYPVREETVRFSDERIRALAKWYRKGKNYQTALHDQAHYFKETVKMKYGVSFHRSWHERFTYLAGKIEGYSSEELESIADKMEQLLQKESIHKQEFVYWSKKIDNLQKEVEAR
ncbi:hypothetical protein J416_10541 [Gracilibacillus halophilus YIM-C55.5]|uniref:DUF4350 domain-containing protein n=1 Tax=Gracilibacillus halophilus YIM-C55.5 TaxID=1308866 RepID=N4WB09_9BACI|nr:DUF4350 domain-containing protein [Gracilibacillus halophilus]ENH96444.1 hypothetical protein J416_10541 [Gracilibacillus halophilus YIM-C55.5]